MIRRVEVHICEKENLSFNLKFALNMIEVTMFVE